MNRLADREARLSEAVERLYDVFRRYRLPETIDPDGCFPSVCDDRPLRASPLRELPEDAFRTYASKAITTWGMVDDFKHFLPRMLELIATPRDDGGPHSFDPFVVFSKIDYGNWRRWPVVEREAVAEFFPALWLAVLIRPGTQIGAGRWLRDFAHIFQDLTPFLRVWEAEMHDEESAPCPSLHLAELIIDSHGPMSKKGSLGWWQGTGQEQQVIRWLSSDAISTILETAFFEAWDDSHAERLSLAVDMHNWWQMHGR